MFGRKINGSPPTRPAAAQGASILMREIEAILSKSAGLHPLDVAARITALFSSPDLNAATINYIQIKDIDQPTVLEKREASDASVGVSFRFTGLGGEYGLLYFTTAFSILAQQGALTGPRVPVDLLTRFIPDYVEAVRALVAQRSPRRSPEDLAQEQHLRSQLREFLG